MKYFFPIKFLKISFKVAVMILSKERFEKIDRKIREDFSSLIFYFLKVPVIKSSIILRKVSPVKFSNANSNLPFS